MKDQQEKTRRIRWVLLPVVLLITSAALLIVRTALQLKATTSLNLVYVESNIGSTSNANSVFGFSNSGGMLTAVAGSPWLTGGTGIYDPGQVKGISEFDADQQVLISPKNDLLFAVNGHSNNFAVFKISSTDGHLTAVSGSPFHSNGSDPVSFGMLYNILSGSKSWLGVVNKGADPGQKDSAPNISAFTVPSSGVPALVSQATVTLGTGSSPSQLVTATGSSAKQQFWAFLDQYLTSGSNKPGVYSYQIQGNGGLKAVNNANDPPDPEVLGLALNPSYRVIYAGLPSINEVGVFTYDSGTGKLTFNNAVANSGKGVGWLAVGPTGTGHFLYTSEPGSGTVSVYSISSSGTKLTSVQQFTLSGQSPMPGNLAFDPTGAYLYCLDSDHAMLHVLTVNASNGKLTEPNAPTALNEPTGNEPLGIAAIQY